MQKTQAGDTRWREWDRDQEAREKDIQGETQVGRGKADQARWVCEFLSSVAPRPGAPPARPPPPQSAHLFERGLHQRAQLGQDLFDLHQNLQGSTGQAVSGPAGGPAAHPAPTRRRCWAEGAGQAGRGEEGAGRPDRWVLAGARGGPQTVTQVASVAFKHQDYFM